MRWKCFLTFLALLIMFNLLSPQVFAANTITRRNNWKVDDDGSADFKIIQEAINAASDGDTIFVYNGTYYENIIVNKTVSLIAESKETKIISQKKEWGAIEYKHEWTEPVILIIAAFVQLRGFTIQNGSCGIDIESSGNIIEDNILTDNGYGIIVGFDLNVLWGNIVTNNEYGIYIRARGINFLRYNNMSNNRYNFGISGSVYPGYVPYDPREFSYPISLIQDVDTSNTVNGKPIYYWLYKRDEVIPSDAGYVGIIGSRNITVANLTLTNNVQGIVIISSKNVTVENLSLRNNVQGIHLQGNNLGSSITNTYVSHNDFGIYLWYSSGNNISQTTIINNPVGVDLGHSHVNVITKSLVANSAVGILVSRSDGNIFSQNVVASNSHAGIYVLHESDDNTIFENTIINNWQGIQIDWTGLNVIFHNNFINNTVQAWVHSTLNGPFQYRAIWDDGYPSGGNYWSDYAGVDLYSGPSQNETDSDGIGDIPYIINEKVSYSDNYPLMKPWKLPDITPPGISISDIILPDYETTPQETENVPETTVSKPFIETPLGIAIVSGGIVVSLVVTILIVLKRRRI